MLRALALAAALALQGCEQPPPPTPAPSEIAPKPLTPPGTRVAGPPRAALAYRADLIRNARLFWGLAAPVATFGGQVHQESAWRPRAQSRFAGGLAQFTPGTATWISSTDPELASGDVFNPAWALRALARYDRHLWDRTQAADSCERMAMTLAAYNGGPGWITREKIAAVTKGLDPDKWFDQVETVCLRADWACKENRAYPRRILLKHQGLYASWGPTTPCEAVHG